jgi:hypothetical protein
VKTGSEFNLLLVMLKASGGPRINPNPSERRVKKSIDYEADSDNGHNNCGKQESPIFVNFHF